MDRKTILWLVIGVVGYYVWLHARRQQIEAVRGYKSGTGAPRGISTTPSTITGSASRTPRTRRQLPALTSPWNSTGTGFVSAPVRSVTALNAPTTRGGPGSRRGRGTRSSGSWNGIGTAGIAPQMPSWQVTPTRYIPIGNGQVQVPSYAAVPLTTRGPGGGGTVLNLGGGR